MMRARRSSASGCRHSSISTTCHSASSSQPEEGMTELDLRGAAAVVGVAESDLGDVGPGRYAIELAAQAAVRALAEAELRPADVDGLFSVVAGHTMSTLDVAEHLAVRA